MSKNEEKVVNLDEEVSVEETEGVITDETEVNNQKKAKVMKVAKVVLKIATYGLVAVGGYLLGKKSGCTSTVEDLELPEVNDIQKVD